MEKYHIYEEIGKGRYSQVFKGREKKNIEYVAIKRVDKGRMNKIVNEVQIMHKLDNPHALRFYDWYETKNNLWLILEYCTGSDMLSLLSQDGHLPEASVRLFGLDMVFALKYLHGLGLLHCDMRPANFLIDEHGILKLSDFKFTRKLSKSYLDSATTSIGRRGTVGYMPSELCHRHGGLHSYESDLYALGCVLYEMRRGFLPYGNANGSGCVGTTTPSKAPQSDEEADTDGYNTLSWESPEFAGHLKLLRATDPVFGPESTAIRAKEMTSAYPAARSNPGTPSNHTHQQSQHSGDIPPLSPEFADLVSWLLSQRVEQRCDWEGLCNHPFWYCANSGVRNPHAPKHLDIKPLVFNAADFPVHPLLEQFKAEAEQKRVAEVYEARLEMLLQGKGMGSPLTRRTPESIASVGTSRFISPGQAQGAVLVDPNIETTGKKAPVGQATPEQERLERSLRSADPSEGTTVANGNIPDALDLNGADGDRGAEGCSNSTENLVINYYKNTYISTDAGRNMMVDADALLLHSSYDLQVKPLVGNKTIEVFEKYSYKAGSLPLPSDRVYLHLSEVNRATMEELEEHLTLVYKALYKMSHAVSAPQSSGSGNSGNSQANAAQTAATNAQVVVDKERMNLLSYLLSISSVAEVANFVLNSQFLYLLLRYIRGSVNPGGSSEGGRSKASSARDAANGPAYAYNVSTHSMFSLPIRGVATTILAIMLRYASTVVPPPSPSGSNSPPHIIASLVQVLKDTNLYNSAPAGGAGTATATGSGVAAQPHSASKFLLRKRCIAALGEMMFYVAAQEEEENEEETDRRKGQSQSQGNQWSFPPGTITVLTRCLRDDMEVPVQHYAAKTVENILAQGSFAYKKKLVGSEIASRLLALALQPASEAALSGPAGGPAVAKMADAMQATAAMALSHLFYLTVTCSGPLLSKLEPPIVDTDAGNTSFGASGGRSRVGFGGSARQTSAAVAAKARPDEVDNTVHSIGAAGRFVTKLLERRGGIVAIIECLKHVLGSSTGAAGGTVNPASTSTIRLQQAYLNIINILFCSKLVVKTGNALLGMESVQAGRGNVQVDLEGSAFVPNARGATLMASPDELITANDVAMRSLRAHVTKTPTCTTLMVRLLEQSTNPLIRAKLLLSLQLFCTVHRPTVAQLTQKRFTIQLCNMVENIISSAAAGNEPECSLASVINTHTPGTALGTATPNNANNAGLYLTQVVLSTVRFTYMEALEGMSNAVLRCSSAIAAPAGTSGGSAAPSAAVAAAVGATSPARGSQRSAKKPTPQSGALHKTPSPQNASRRQPTLQAAAGRPIGDVCTATEVRATIDGLRAHLGIVTGSLSMCLRRLVVDDRFVLSLCRALQGALQLAQTHGGGEDSEGGALVDELMQVLFMGLEMLCTTRVVDEIDYQLIVNCNAMNPTASPDGQPQSASPDPHVNNGAYLRAVVDELLPCILHTDAIALNYDVKLSIVSCVRKLLPMLFKCLWLLSDVPVEAEDVDDITAGAVGYCESAPCVVDTVASYRDCLQRLVSMFNSQCCSQFPSLLCDAPPSPVPQYVVQLLTDVLCVSHFITAAVGAELLNLGVADSLLEIFSQCNDRRAGHAPASVEDSPRDQGDTGDTGMDLQVPYFFRNLVEFGGADTAKALIDRGILHTVLGALQGISRQMSESQSAAPSPYVEASAVSVVELAYYTTQHFFQLLRNKTDAASLARTQQSVADMKQVCVIVNYMLLVSVVQRYGDPQHAHSHGIQPQEQGHGQLSPASWFYDSLIGACAPCILSMYDIIPDTILSTWLSGTSTTVMVGGGEGGRGEAARKCISNMRTMLALLLSRRELDDGIRSQLLKLLLCMAKAASISSSNPKMRSVIKGYLLSEPMFPAIDGIGATDLDAGLDTRGTVSPASASLACKICSIAENSL